MPELLELWLPIVAAAAMVFIVSSVIHMATPMHKSDWRHLPAEAAVLDGIRAAGVEQGQYMFPACNSMKETTTPEYIAKLQRGPVGIMVIRASGSWGMGAALMQWFLFTIIVSAMCAWILSLSTAKGAAFDAVFSRAAVIAFLGYGFSSWSESIWKGVSWWTAFKFTIDGLLYALGTALAFAWLWPSA